MTVMRIMSLSLLVILIAAAAHAQEAIDYTALVALGSRCSGLNEQIIKSIIYVESRGNPYAVNVNGVGGFQPSTLRDALRVLYKYNRANSDLGLMQINYLTWGRATKLTPIQMLDPEINVCLGSVILRDYINTHGGWKGVGRYNAVSPKKQREYILRVASIYRRIK